MHNMKNVVLMFLIIMLSFAIVPEVSAVACDDAEPAESGLNKSFNSSDLPILDERSHEVFQGHDDAVDNSYSNNNQTSLSEVSKETHENKNLYEMGYGMPLGQKSHGVESQNSQGNDDGKNAEICEKSSEIHNNVCLHHSSSEKSITPKFREIRFGEVCNNVTSQVTDVENALFSLVDAFTFNNGDPDMFNMDLHFQNIISNNFLSLKENISILENRLPEFSGAIPKSQINDFLLNMHSGQNTHPFPNIMFYNKD